MLMHVVVPHMSSVAYLTTVFAMVHSLRVPECCRGNASVQIEHLHTGVVCGGDEGSEALFACCRVELRTQEAERGMNSEEAEKLVWAAQTIFATGCKLRLPAVSQLDHLPMLHYACRCESLLAVHVLRYHSHV